MFDNLRSYFLHHRKERNGTIAVLCLSLLLIISAMIFPRVVKPDAPDSELMAWYEQQQSFNETSFAGKDQYSSDSLKARLFKFDPNTLSDSGYRALGFSEKEIGILRKYMKAGATFREKNDFGKLYFMDQVRFDSIRPYLRLPEKAGSLPKYQADKYQAAKEQTTKWSDTARVSSFKYNPIIADLNTSDTTELKKLPGIGSFYAKKIVEYREALGGYFDLAQLLELWKMTPENIDRFADRVSIDPSAVRKIEINRATTQRMSEHPYISFSLANKIVNYREEHGLFSVPKDLQDAGLLSEELRLKLAPYLQFE